MSTYHTLKVDRSDRITTIKLNRPDAANTMNLQMVRELADAAAQVNYTSSKVVVLTGAGKFFCAGGDLGDFAAATGRSQHIRAIADALHRAISTFSRMGAVVICAVNGTAAGAGLSLAGSADLVIATESASFTMAYTRVGLSPDGGASFYLPRLIGVRRTQELMFTNRTLSAVEARDWGLVTEVVPDDALEVRTYKLANNFAAGPAQSNRAVKKLLLESFRNGLEEQMELEGQLIADNAGTADGREGIDAFLEKRPARYK